MKIPKKIQIVGSVFEIVIENEENRRDDTDGVLRMRESKIRLRKERFMSQQYLETTFFHEILHAILLELGEREVGTNERFVERVSSALYQVYKQIGLKE